MKTLKFLLICAVALIALAGCESDELDEAYYASHATITSSDPNFTSDSDGGTIHFNAEGGEVTILVSCDTEFSTGLEQEYPVTFAMRKEYIENSCYHLTVIAEQNLFMQEQTGKVKLATLSGINFAVINIIQDACDSPITIGMNEWNVPAVGELSTTITVTSTGEWTFSNEADWLTVDKTETGITLTANENTKVTERSCEVVLTGTDGVNSVSETITVTQDGLAYITLSDEELLLSNSEGAISVTVESNFEWTYNCDADWFTIEKEEEENSIKIAYTANSTGIDRETVVIITAGDGASNVAEAELKITQSWENIDALILEYTITSNNTTIYLPISGIGGSSVTVDWDDGTTSSSSYHRYSTPGIYTITISGHINALSSCYSGSNTVKDGVEYLTAVKQWGRNFHPSSMERAFYKCKNLVSLPEGTDLFSNVTSFFGAFCGCSSLTTIPENIFMNCTTATNFESVFYRCYSLTSAPSFEGCSNATSFANAFIYCYDLTSLPENMFSGCTAVTTFHQTFYDCNSLTSAPSFEGCSSVTSFEDTFYNCTSLTTIPENMFSGCTAVTTFRETFYNCSSLTFAPSFEGCSNVTSFYECFRNCSSLTAVPENMFSGCTALTSFGYTFYGCSALKSVPVCLFDDTFSVTYFGYTFDGCSSVVGESPYTELEVTGEKVKVHLYERSNYAVEMRFTIPTGYSNCFRNSTFSDIDSIPSSWGGNGN